MKKIIQFIKPVIEYAGLPSIKGANKTMQSYLHINILQKENLKNENITH